MSRSATPAATAAALPGIAFAVHEYEHHPGAESYGLQAAAALGVNPVRVYKSLVVAGEGGRLAVAIIPVPPGST